MPFSLKLYGLNKKDASGSKIRTLAFFCCLIALLSQLLACGRDSLSEGVVASVNGEHITLHAIQAFIDTRSASLGIQPRPSLAEMQKNYGRALSVLIVHALVRQELEAREISVNPADLEQAIGQIKEEFGSDRLNKYFSESSIREEDWRQFTRDHMALEIFRNQVLLPGIKISLDEIKDYYKEHEADFTVPEMYNVCFVSSVASENLAAWCASLEKGNIDFGPAAQCLDIEPGEIPPEWKKNIKNMKPYSCGKISEENGVWQSMALIARNRRQRLGIAEVYALIENILLGQKQQDAFNRWLEKRISQSRILVAPQLNYCLAEEIQRYDDDYGAETDKNHVSVSVP